MANSDEENYIASEAMDPEEEGDDYTSSREAKIELEAGLEYVEEKFLKDKN